MKKIAITGTKGKTTIVRMLESILSSLGKNVLSVDSELVRLKSELLFDTAYSKKVYGMIPSKCPGRFLYLGYNSRENDWNIDCAVFETVIGCYGSGLGYDKHDIGIFTNIFEDHIGTSGIKNQNDLAKRKASFISKITPGGTIVYNFDDVRVKKYLSVDKNIHKIIVTEKKRIANIDQFSSVVFIRPGYLEIRKNTKKYVVNLQNNIFTFSGNYSPSVWNLAFVIAGLIAFFENDFFKNFDLISEKIHVYTGDIYGGRMVAIPFEGKTILLDYAHEKESLQKLLKFAKDTVVDGKVTAVVRLAPDRPNELYAETGEIIGSLADNFIVYDKIDGIERKQYTSATGKIVRGAGEVMALFSKGIQKGGGKVQEVIYWKDAMKFAIESASIGDMVVIIVNDPKETGEYIKGLLKL